jgi:predicted ATPase/class 3 adenylate cyclase
MTTIGEWLTSLGLNEYSDLFVANAIDVSILGELTEKDLKEIGIPLGHRRKILKAIGRGDAPPIAIDPDTSTPQFPPPFDAGPQRRQLSVLFCDLVGSTALSARLDPEDTRSVIACYQTCIAETVAKHNGVIARYMGDGALVYFGYPRAREDDTEQAVHAALALIDEIPRLKTKIDIPLQGRIGIATGTVVIGDVLSTDTGSHEQAAIGDAPNMAARLQSLAEPGTIVVCPSTRQLTLGYFNYRDLGKQILKGWSEPIQVWQAIGATGVENRFQAQHPTVLSPLIGRDEEVELLMRRWQAVRQGAGRAVLVTGEPGIGKTHIVRAAESLLDGEAHTTLSYLCSTHHTNSALYPFTSQLERAARFERSDSALMRRSKLEFLVSEFGLNESQIEVLSSLLSLPANPSHLLKSSTPQKRKEATFTAIFAVFESLARRKPTFIVFEDIHWIDPTSLELLTLMIERLPEQRLLLAMTARPEFLPPWPSHAHVSTILLTRFNRVEGAMLVQRVAGGKPLPHEVVAEILARTDGVPLFVEELTKALLESGQLLEQPDGYVVERSLPHLIIPATLHASLISRLDRLSAAREVAQIGAVIGREFSYELLSAIAGLPKKPLDDALEQLTLSELIFRRGVLPQAVFSFKHALVRDAAYEGLLKSRRAQLHGSLANVLESNFRDIIEAQPEIMAHHLIEAGFTERAIPWWRRAGIIAAQRSAHVEAIAHFRRGVDAVHRLGGRAPTDRMELDLLMAMGPCLIATQGPARSDSVAMFTRAHELCERLGDPPEYLQVMFWLATASVMRGELPRAQETVAALLDRAESRGDHAALLNALRGKAMILMFMGRITEAAAAIERAFAAYSTSSEEERLAARAAGQDAGVADLALMSWTLWLTGKPDTATKRITAALQRADAIVHPPSQAYANYYASILYAMLGRYQQANDHASCCVILSHAHGFRQWHDLSRTVANICIAQLDPSSNVIDEAKAALKEYGQAGYQLGITALHALMCSAMLARGDADGVIDLLESSFSTVEHNSERLFEAELYRLKGRAIERLGGANAVRDCTALLERALGTARQHEARSLELRAANDLALVLRSQRKRDAALAVLEPICSSFTEGADTDDLVAARATLATL